MKRNSAVTVEAKCVTKWNKKRLNRKCRRNYGHTRYKIGTGKSGYKRSGWDGRNYTMA